VTTHSRSRSRGTGIDAVERAARGAVPGTGEILRTSMDADSTRDGYDIADALRAAGHVVRSRHHLTPVWLGYPSINPSLARS
jgi:cyclase